MEIKLNIAITSHGKNVYSESFIKARRKMLDGLLRTKM